MRYEGMVSRFALVFVAACASQRATSSVTLEAPSPLPASPSTVAVAPVEETPTLWGLRPGMTEAEVEARLGKAGERRTRADTEEWWTSAGYDPKTELPFILGFDEEVSYNDEDTDQSLAVWNVYYTKGRAVLLKAALSLESVKDTPRFGFPPSCFIGADASSIALTFGQPDAIVGTTRARRMHYYLRRGVVVMEDTQRVKVLDIFAPLSESRAREVLTHLR